MANMNQTLPRTQFRHMRVCVCVCVCVCDADMCMLVCTRVFFPVWKAMLLIRPQRVAWSSVEIQLELDSEALTVHRTTPETVVLSLALLTKFHRGKLAKFLWMTWDKFALWSAIFCCLQLHSFMTVQTVCKCVCKTPCFYQIFAKIMPLLHESSPSVPRSPHLLFIHISFTIILLFLLLLSTCLPLSTYHHLSGCCLHFPLSSPAVDRIGVRALWPVEQVTALTGPWFHSCAFCHLPVCPRLILIM